MTLRDVLRDCVTVSSLWPVTRAAVAADCSAVPDGSHVGGTAIWYEDEDTPDFWEIIGIVYTICG